MPAKSKTPSPRNGGRSALDSAIWSVCDVMRRSNCAGAMQYVPELTWILFLRILDEREEIEAEESQAVGADFRPSLSPPYRWRDWAAPDSPGRTKLTKSTTNAFYDFVNTTLIPHLKALRDTPNATPRQKVISEIMSGVDRTRIDTQRNLLDVLDKIHDINLGSYDDTHVFALSQVYEGLLLRMGEKGNDGGQFFTPREVIRAVVEVVSPKPGETICDPCCGTGGFLAQAYEFIRKSLGDDVTGGQIDALKHTTFYGREKENLVYPIALANLVLHGIDHPHIQTNQEAFIQTKRRLLDTCDLWCVVSLPAGVFTATGAGVKTNLLFFTKGKPTKKIWYYDLSDVKVGKKTPFTRAHLGEFLKLLPKRGDSEKSWSVDIAARRRKAKADADAIRATTAEPKSLLIAARAELAEHKKAQKSAKRQETIKEQIKEHERAIREIESKADAVESAAFDLKAVNPNAKTNEDTRTPAQLLDLIASRNQIVADLVARLNAY